MKLIVVLLLLTIVTATVVNGIPKARRQTQCYRKSDCQRQCQSVQDCRYGTCYCNTSG
uniref:CSab-Iso-6 n=2 Tax=Buthidae TaxID=6856 RepID=T1E7N4_9SCOR